MSLSTISIKRPVFTIVINLLIILFGIIGYSYLGVREFPSIDPAQISVRTNYTGANADIIESQITEPLEKAINSIDGIRNITSSSNQGSSNITIEFKLEKNLEEAANDVRDKVSQAIRSLPQDIDAPPVVSKADADSDAIISMTVQSDTKSVLELSDYAENVIAERLQTIPGVSGVQIWGQKRYAMRIWLDPVKLNAYGVTVSDVRIALEKQNVELPSGKLTGANTELTVKTLGNLSSETEFNNIIVLARVAAVKTGNPLDPTVMMGAQASKVQRDKIMSYINLGKEEGAELLIGGDENKLGGDLDNGYYIKPTVFKGTNKMRIFQEEIFGPVLAVTTFKTTEEAIEIANDTLYGLGAGVWTRDAHELYQVPRAIHAGRVWVNSYHAYPAGAPFGGYKQSGIGRENHKMMLAHYRQTKNMLISYNKNKLGFF